MSEIVDRLVTAMVEALRKSDPHAFIHARDARVMVDGNFNFEAVARAAVEAMREPTEAMRRSGVAGYSNGDPDDTIYLSGIGDAWRAMITTALE